MRYDKDWLVDKICSLEKESDKPIEIIGTDGKLYTRINVEKLRVSLPHEILAFTKDASIIFSIFDIISFTEYPGNYCIVYSFNIRDYLFKQLKKRRERGW